jgi:MAF protein
MHQLILASESPRRKSLLLEAGFFFHTFHVKVSEILDKNLTSSLTIEQQILKISETKVQAALLQFKPISHEMELTSENGPLLFLSADTMVVYNGIALGKPKDENQAFDYLRMLSGQVHEVMTAITLVETKIVSQNEINKLKIVEKMTKTKVRFRDLSDQEIRDYIATKEPMDKAGAYGIQGQGRNLVDSYDGPLDNVIGLPIATLKKVLIENHWSTKGCQLLAVSKLQPVEKIRSLYQTGQRQFAENYVQEALEKQKLLAALPNIEWHFIGTLQKNKTKNVVGNFKIIHSVDSQLLAEKISHEAIKKGLVQQIILQINLAKEATKSGFDEKTLLMNFSNINELRGIKVVGLMTMPPLSDDPEKTRPYFKNLRLLAQNLGLQELSMGTSSDYNIALEEGSTMVRLGTVIFGQRPAKKEILQITSEQP